MLTLKEIKQHIREPYAWPGGYQKVFLTTHGSLMSIEGAKQYWPSVVYAYLNDFDHDKLSDVFIHWEGENEYCCVTNELIESEYGPIEG